MAMNDTGKCDVLVVSQDSARAEIVGMCVKSIMDEQVDMDVDLEVDNPNPEALHLVDIEFLVEDLAVSSEDHPVIVKQVQHSCAIQPRTSEVIKVPLQFAYKNVKPPGNSGPGNPSRSGSAGRIIPFTIRARVNCFEVIRGMFAITISKLKQFLTIVDDKLGIGKLRNFVPPTGMLNGSRFVRITPDEVMLSLEARVKNGNPLPIQLVYTNVSMEMNNKLLDVQRIDHNMTLSARSSRKVTIPYTFSLKDHLGEHGGLEPGTVVPYSVKLEYWFKENFHGMYKVSAEKTGELPVPARSTAKIQAASFNFDELGRPIAKVCMKLENRNTFSIKVTKLKCEIIRNSDGICAATAEDAFVETDRAMEVEAGGNGSIWMVASTGTSEETFGSALWDVFAGDYSRFTVLATVESETKFGKMVS
ncbi:uncharacterized protein LOC9651743 isoform X1 [Selaginella moellendorffii]|uniref:uncharacterized protein LOC9651743 isoform X1 n=1 Tax=Selaginella moellendorffii TaxID=88036 RepID=UPI000D1D0188|nr:uncharacterized protein LOC9651743 isoform X1 [Selaginella moellendorffii]|eukprot:XP_024533563.1 uncharacterized protein LOC9651743 isoform X1 [Selaginella moellendorffii]